MSETSVKSSNSKSKTTKNRAFIYDMVLISISAALIAVCSWISIPLGPVPFTLQTLGILAVMLTAGGRRGTIAVLVYLALGAVGVPVFAGFKGGIASFAGPTGGFLVGFLVSALVYWLLEKLFLKKLMTQGRSISVREAARLQSFPDDFEFAGAMSSQFKQIGNAVPPLFAYVIAERLKTVLKENSL